MKRILISIGEVVILVMISIGIILFFMVKPRSTACSVLCVNNLRMIDSGKEQWALANHKTNGQEVVISGVNEYIKGSTTPVCPQGGTYTCNSLGRDPECSGETILKNGQREPHRLPR